MTGPSGRRPGSAAAWPLGEAISLLCVAWVVALLPLHGSPSPGARAEVPGAGVWVIVVLLAAATQAPRLLPRAGRLDGSGLAVGAGALVALVAWALTVFAVNLVGALPAGPIGALLPMAGGVRIVAALTITISLALLLPTPPAPLASLEGIGAWLVLGAHCLFAAVLLVPGLATASLAGLVESAGAGAGIAVASRLVSIVTGRARPARLEMITALLSVLLVAGSVVTTLQSLSSPR